MIPISDLQKKIIKNTFVCERLSSSEENLELINSFSNSRGDSLVSYLQSKAWEMDKSGEIAFYVIKAKGVGIVLFFSIQCGSLFVPLDEENITNGVIEFLNKNSKANIQSTLELMRRNPQAYRNWFDNVKSNIIVFAGITRDKKNEPNENVIRVDEIYSGVELVHFCANELVRDFWDSLKLGHPMGEVLFWSYIAPVIISIRNTVGCKYVYLYAADISKEGELINYYNSLNFERPDCVGIAKPFYDFGCQFMCQEICALHEGMSNYFADFNIDPNVPFI